MNVIDICSKDRRLDLDALELVGLAYRLRILYILIVNFFLKILLLIEILS